MTGWGLHVIPAIPACPLRPESHPVCLHGYCERRHCAPARLGRGGFSEAAMLHYQSAQQRRFPEPFVREIEERFGDCLDTDHSAGRGNGMSGIVAGKQPNEAERIHRGERAPRRGLDCRPNVRAEPSTVPNAAPHKSKVEDFAHSPVPQSQPTTTTPIWPFSSSRAYRWPRSALRTPRTLRLWPPGIKEDRLVGLNERALSLPDSHTRRISAPSRNSWQGDSILSLCEQGDRAMWIVMYVAMIASLSAMGMLPVAEYRDQLPHDDA